MLPVTNIFLIHSFYSILLIIIMFFLFIWYHIFIDIIVYHHLLLMFFSLQFFDCPGSINVIETEGLPYFLQRPLRVRLRWIFMALCNGVLADVKLLVSRSITLKRALPIARLDATRDSADKFLFTLIKYFDVVNMLVYDSLPFIHLIKRREDWSF